MSKFLAKIRSNLGLFTDLNAGAPEPGHFGVNASELEARILYSASPLPIADIVEQIDNSLVELESLDQLDDFFKAPDDVLVASSFNSVGELSNSDTTSEETLLGGSSQGTNIVFVDSGIDELEQIVNDLSGIENQQVIVLDSDRDGIEQVTEILKSQQNVQSLHFFSHGTAGEIRLGDATLSLDTLDEYQLELGSWNSHLTWDADILFYGCDLAADESGMQLVDRIGEITGADIAASDDLTGHHSLGGDWELEYVAGLVDTSIVVSGQSQSEWEFVLPVDVVNGPATLWLATEADVTDGNGFSWTREEIVEFEDPTLQFEPEAGTTDGTFESTGFVSPRALNGIHVVGSSTITVGGATLFQGDLLFSVVSNHNFGGFSANERDIVLFRPDTINDYSAGTYFKFLDNAFNNGSNRTVEAISLIERDTWIGNTLLSAGTFLTAEADDIYTFSVNDTELGGGSDRTNGQLLIEGSGANSNLDLGGNSIQGIEVLESDVQLGNTTIAQGSILLSIDAVGLDIDPTSNFVGVNAEDLFYLTVNSASPEGTTDATASYLMQGAEVGLSEEITAITIANSNSRLVANDDSFSVSGNTVLNVSSPGLLGNDVIFEQNLTPGATLAFEGHTNSSPTEWQDSTNAAGFDIDMVGGVTFNASPDDATPGIVSSYSFDGSGAGFSTSAFNDLAGDPTNNPATLELWFRPDSPNRKEVIYESGQAGPFQQGHSLRLNNGDLEFVVYDGLTFAAVTADISGLLAPPAGSPLPFVQVAMTFDIVDADSDSSVDDIAVGLYVNGVLEGTTALLNANQWSDAIGAQTFALGGVDGNAFFLDGGTSVFQGEIGALRLYESVLTGAEIQNNFDAAQLQVTSFDATSASGAAVSVNADGSFSYDSGNVFDYLSVGQSANDTFSYTVQDNLGFTSTAEVTVTVNGVNDAPEITTNGGGATAAINVAENSTAVTTVSASDVDLPASTLTYTISGGADLGLFSISSGGDLVFTGGRDFETFTDADSNGVYEVQVTASDTAGAFDVQDISVTITDVNDAPIILSDGGGSTASKTIAENTTTVTTISVFDADLPANTLTYTISGGADSALFTVNSTGVLAFTNARDFETFTDVGLDGVYDVQVTVADGRGGFDVQDISVTIADANDAPVIVSDGGGNMFFTNVAENSVAVTTVVATDQDLPANTLTYTITGGADSSLFTISSSGDLEFTGGRDFETFSDNDSNGVYEVQVTASDGIGGLDFQDISVTITDENEAPIITSDGGNATAAINVSENTTAVTTVLVSDEDLPADTLTYAISGGADSGLFVISSSGDLEFSAGRDFETFIDADLDGVYEVQVTVSDGNITDVQDISVTITDANDAPIITSDGGNATAAINVAENTTAVTTVLASDVDLPVDSLTYSISGGADIGLFAINASGDLVFTGDRDFESFTDNDFDGVYEVQVTVSDGNGGFDVQDISVTITDGNESPTVSLTNVVLNLPEDTTTATSIKIADIQINDDALGANGLRLTGADAGSFEIVGLELYLRADTVLDFETKSNFDVTVEVDDATLGGPIDSFVSTQLTIDDSNEAPSISLENVINQLPEDFDTSISTKIADIVVSDDAMGSNVLSLSGSDAGLFEIVGAELHLRAGVSLDHETLSALDVTVEVNDISGGFVDAVSQTVEINDVNEAPVLTTNELMISEGETVTISIVNVAASDVDDSATLTYSLSNVAQGQFESTTNPGVAINSFTPAEIASGEIVFVHDGNELAPTYDIQVSDGQFDDGPFPAAITFTNVNDAPTGESDAFAVGLGGSTVIGNVLTNDSDVDSLTTAAALQSQPSNGTVSLDADGTFVYSPNAVFSGTDSFTYVVSDGVSNSEPVTVFVVVAGPVAPVNTVSEPEPEEEEDDDEAALLEVDTTSQEAPKTIAGTKAQPVASTFGGKKQNVATSSMELNGSAFVTADADGGTASLDRRASEFAEIIIAPPRTTSAVELDFMDESGWFWQKLEQNKDYMETNAKIPQALLGATAAITSGMTVGYLVWIVKGGQIAAAVMANMPAWRLIGFDPLPLLGSMADADDGDDDSLETIIQDGQDDLDVQTPEIA